MPVALSCEQRLADGFLGQPWQPANTVTAFAFVVAGLVIILSGTGDRGRVGDRARWPYGLLVAAVGVGSVVQHGPHPTWQEYAHDLPLAAVLGFVAVDAASDLRGRRLSALWWLVPTAALVPFIMIGPLASTLAQAALATAAIGWGLLRARARPRLRRVLLTALAILAVGALIGTLGERTGLCRPDSLWQGHAVWHVLAAVALWRLAPAIGARSAER